MCLYYTLNKYYSVCWCLCCHIFGLFLRWRFLIASHQICGMINRIFRFLRRQVTRRVNVRACGSHSNCLFGERLIMGLQNARLPILSIVVHECVLDFLTATYLIKRAYLVSILTNLVKRRRSPSSNDSRLLLINTIDHTNRSVRLLARLSRPLWVKVHRWMLRGLISLDSFASSP